MKLESVQMVKKTLWVRKHAYQVRFLDTLTLQYLTKIITTSKHFILIHLNSKINKWHHFWGSMGLMVLYPTVSECLSSKSWNLLIEPTTACIILFSFPWLFLMHRHVILYTGYISSLHICFFLKGDLEICEDIFS